MTHSHTRTHTLAAVVCRAMCVAVSSGPSRSKKAAGPRADPRNSEQNEAATVIQRSKSKSLPFGRDVSPQPRGLHGTSRDSARRYLIQSRLAPPTFADTICATPASAWPQPGRTPLRPLLWQPTFPACFPSASSSIHHHFAHSPRTRYPGRTRCTSLPCPCPLPARPGQRHGQAWLGMAHGPDPSAALTPTIDMPSRSLAGGRTRQAGKTAQTLTTLTAPRGILPARIVGPRLEQRQRDSGPARPLRVRSESAPSPATPSAVPRHLARVACNRAVQGRRAICEQGHNSRKKKTRERSNAPLTQGMQ